MSFILPVELTKNFHRCKQRFFEANRLFRISILKTDYFAFLNQAFLLETYLPLLVKKFCKWEYVYRCRIKG